MYTIHIMHAINLEIETVEWLNDNLPPDSYKLFWDTILFNNEEDAVLFKLRFGL